MSASTRRFKADSERAHWHWGTTPERASFPMEHRIRKLNERVIELQRSSERTHSLIRKRNIGRKLHNIHKQIEHWKAMKLAWMLAQP